VAKRRLNRGRCHLMPWRPDYVVQDIGGTRHSPEVVASSCHCLVIVISVRSAKRKSQECIRFRGVWNIVMTMPNRRESTETSARWPTKDSHILIKLCGAVGRVCGEGDVLLTLEWCIL
jgi:hypothetical protein